MMSSTEFKSLLIPCSLDLLLASLSLLIRYIINCGLSSTPASFLISSIFFAFFYSVFFINSLFSFDRVSRAISASKSFGVLNTPILIVSSPEFLSTFLERLTLPTEYSLIFHSLSSGIFPILPFPATITFQFFKSPLSVISLTHSEKKFLFH